MLSGNLCVSYDCSCWVFRYLYLENITEMSEWASLILKHRVGILSFFSSFTLTCDTASSFTCLGHIDLLHLLSQKVKSCGRKEWEVKMFIIIKHILLKYQRINATLFKNNMVKLVHKYQQAALQYES